MKLGRIGHFVITALGALTGVVAEMQWAPTSTAGHAVSWLPFLAAGGKWLHYEISKLGGSA